MPSPVKRRIGALVPPAPQWCADSLQHVLSFLPYDEQVRLQVCSTAFRRAARVSRLLTPPAHVLRLFDDLVAGGCVWQAESLLRPFVGWSLLERSYAPYVSKYLVLVGADVLPGGHLRRLFRTVQRAFQQKALRELARFHRLRPGADAGGVRAILECLGTATSSSPRSASPSPSSSSPSASLSSSLAPLDTTAAAGASAGARASAGAGASAGGPGAGAARISLSALIDCATSAAKRAKSSRDAQLGVPPMRATYSASRVGVENTCITAFLLLCSGQTKPAAELAWHAVQCDPQSALAHWVLGSAARDADACAALVRSLHLDPGFASGYYGLGIAVGRMGRAGGPTCASAVARCVEQLFEACVAVDPRHHLALKRLGTMQQHLTPAARLHGMLRVCSVHPTDADAARRAYRLLREAAVSGDEKYAQQCMRLAHRVLLVATHANPTGVRGAAWGDLGHLYLTVRRDPAGAFSFYDAYEQCDTVDPAGREFARASKGRLLDMFDTWPRHLR